MLTENLENFDVKVNVYGGGITGKAIIIPAVEAIIFLGE
jgi:ribosomal protein S9